MTSLFTAFDSRWLSRDNRHGGTSWAGAIPRGSVAAVLLLQGPVLVEWSSSGSGTAREIAANSLLWLNTTAPLLERWHLLPSTSPHEALLLVFPVDWVHASLGSLRQEMAPDFQALLLGPSQFTP